MKKIGLGILGALLVLLCACGKMDDVVYSENMDVNIEGYVFDGVTEVPLQSVLVTGSFGKEKTDADGYYAIEGLDMGEYRFEVAAEGYMTKVLTETFMRAEDDFKGDELSFLLMTKMYKKDEGISTQLVKSTGPTFQALSNMPYIIKLGAQYKNRFIYGHTDANGMLVDTVPDDAFTIVVDTVIDHISYKCTRMLTGPEALQKSYSVTLSDLSVDPLYVTAANIVDEEGAQVMAFTPSSAVVLNFSRALNTEESVVELKKSVSGSYYSVKADVVYSNGGKTLTVSPYDGSFDEGVTYQLSINAEAAADEKATYSHSFYFTTSTALISNLAKPKVFSLKSPAVIQEDTRSIDFQITVDEQSTSLEIYGRYDNSLEFVEMYNGIIYNWANEENGIVRINNFDFMSLPGIDVSSWELFSDNKDFEIMVRSKVYNNGKWVLSEFSDVITIRSTMSAN